MKPPRARTTAAAPKRPAVLTGPMVPVLRWPPDEDRVEAVFARLSGVMPDPKTELNYGSPFTLVVAVGLGAQL